MRRGRVREGAAVIESGSRTPRIVLAWLGLVATLAGIGLAISWPVLVMSEDRARVGDLEARLRERV